MRLPETNKEAEQSVIATLLMNNKDFQACEFLEPEEFYYKQTRLAYETMRQMHHKKHPVDLVTLGEELKKHGNLESVGAGYLAKVVDIAPAFNIKHHVKIIKDLALTRKIKETCLSAVDNQATGDDLLECVQSEILKIHSSTTEDAIKPLSDIIIAHIERIEKANETEQEAGFKLGFPAIDRRLRVKDGKLIIIAGRPGMGKTALAVTCARNLDKQGVKVGFLSIEMPESEIVDRWVAMESKVDSSKIGKYKGLEKKDITAVNDAASVLFESNIQIDSTGSLDILDVKRKCRKMAQAGVQVIFIDQLSQIGNRKIKAGEKTALFTENCTELARLKKELGIPIFLLCQLNRDLKNRQNKEPILSDLKQTGQIEEDADAVLFIHRPEEYETKPEVKQHLRGRSVLILAKNRSGPTYRDDKIIFSHSTTYFFQGM